MGDYEQNREDFIGGDEIPVATPADNSSVGALIPKKDNDGDDELLIKFRKPYNFEDQTYKDLDLSGLEDLTGRDLTVIEKAFNKTGVSAVVPESTTTFAKIVATRVSGFPAEFFESLPAGELEKIKNAVVGFLYKED